MKTALYKDGIKEIKYSYKRFLSILLIVLLGVGFFAGLRATSPDMKKTLDTYFDNSNVMDIQIISTLGLTNDDIVAIKDVENIELVEGSYQTDAIITVEEEDIVVKLETYSNEINKLEIVDGRMPENSEECIVESDFIQRTGHSIGDVIKVNVEDITNENGEKEKVLKSSTVKIVGTVKSPLYISTERGNTKLGSGRIEYYLYMPKENINVDMYTNIYLTVAGAKDLNTTSDKYSDKIEEVKNDLENISEERREARYNELYESANLKIEEAEKELNNEKEKAEKELKKAQEKINEGKKQIEDGKEELETNRENANNQFVLAEREIEESKLQIEEQETKFEVAKKEAENKMTEYEKQLSSLKQIKIQLNELNKNLDIANEKLETLNSKLENVIDEEKEQIKIQINQVNIQIKALQNSIVTIENELKKQGINNIDKTINQLESGIESANEELSNGEKEIKEAKEKIAEAENELKDSKGYTYYELEQAEEKIKKAEKELISGEEELEEAKKEFNNKIKEAEDKLLEAKEDLKKIERPEWFVLSREQNTGYASYVQDTDRVANLAEVFPVVFFLVAALMSLTSMARMVEEERVQIGTLKALGYNKLQISTKYLVYAILATVIGGGIGLIIGFNFLPKIIADMYALVYEVPEVIIEFNIDIAFLGVFSATLCTVGATLYTCTKELIHNPATLMRPKAPKQGKRVILEKIPFIWNRLNFTAKVTARNLFRYKKRFLMTIIGVCGCTSLIIAGFGLRDAISNMIPNQYGEIYKYNISISLKEEKYDDDLKTLENKILEKDEITETLGVNVQSVKIIKNDNNQNIQLVVPSDINKMYNFITLRNRNNQKEKYTLDTSGIIITEKLANLLDIKEGDIILIENSEGDRAEVKVARITENYIMHYIYMAPELYNTIYDTRIESNVIFAMTNELNEEQEDILGKTLLDDTENISGVSFTSDSKDMFSTVMDNMDMIVWILIIAAGLLALIVLYNLLNANISERIRELATIKVLGFYDREVYSYIGRETIILTIIGILFGLIGGNILTMYILKTCEMDITMFDPDIQIWSYILGIVITVIFAIIVNIVTYFSLKKIDMIESLKSVE